FDALEEDTSLGSRDTIMGNQKEKEEQNYMPSSTTNVTSRGKVGLEHNNIKSREASTKYWVSRAFSKEAGSIWEKIENL
ncbi:hypothetical protein HAX54_035627, partial [Datura stramonium]|nr:hypothetical protein [Datura stramonium]